MSLLDELIKDVPAVAVEGLEKVIKAIAAGDADSAEREARVTAETVAAELAIDVAYEAGAKARGT